MRTHLKNLAGQADAATDPLPRLSALPIPHCQQSTNAVGQQLPSAYCTDSEILNPGSESGFEVEVCPDLVFGVNAAGDIEAGQSIEK